MKGALLGLGLCAGLAAVGFGADALGLPGGPVLWALIAGAVVGNLGAPTGAARGVALAERVVLGVALVGLGLQLDGGVLAGAGRGAAVSVGVVVVTVPALAGAARALGLPVDLALLLGVGQGVCGSAAVAAAVPAARADHDAAAVAMATINTLGTLGLLLVPVLAARLGGDAAALVVGGSLQSVGHVVAASQLLDPAAGQLALVLKLVRVATLPVVVAVVAWWRGGRGGAALPRELIGFAVAAAVGLGLGLPVGWAPTVKLATEVALCVAMAAIGTKVTWRSVAARGPRALVVTAAVFVAQVLALVALAGVAR